MHFLEWKFSYFDSNITDFCSLGQIRNTPALVHVMAWRRTGDKPFLEPMMPRDLNGCLHYNDVTLSAMASQITSLTIVYSTVYSCAYQRQHQSSTSLAFVRGIHRWPVNSPSKGPVTRKMFPFDDVITYSCCSSAYFVQVYFRLGDHTTDADLSQAIHNMPYLRGATYTHLGLELMRTDVLSKVQCRDDIAK